MKAALQSSSTLRQRTANAPFRKSKAFIVKPVAYRGDTAKEPQSSAKSERQLGRAARYSGGWAVMQQGEPLKPWHIDYPQELQPGEIDIDVTHNGVCHSDIHMQANDWDISKFPFMPGHEVIGTVRAVGSSVTSLRPGQRVGVGWMRDSCRRCAACLKGEENLCEPGYTGTIVMGNNGGFQAVLRVPADFAFTIPDQMDSADAAPMLCAGITVYAPLRKWLTRPGMRVAVLGIGGLGHLAIQFANVMGGIVTAIDKFADKEKEAHRLGAQYFEVFDETLQDRAAGRFDVILNCASASIPTGPVLQMLRKDGVLVQIGIPGQKAQMTLPLTDLVFGQKKVVGSIVGGRSDMNSMFELAGTKGIKPMIEVMPSTKVNEALEYVKSGKARYRVVLEMKDDPVLESK